MSNGWGTDTAAIEAGHKVGKELRVAALLNPQARGVGFDAAAAAPVTPLVHQAEPGVGVGVSFLWSVITTIPSE